MIFSIKPDDRGRFTKSVSGALGDIYEQIASVPTVGIEQLVTDNAALIIIDMVNGFVKEGALYSPNALAINDTVASLARLCADNGIPIAALCDSHKLSSPEFLSYPPHCVEGSEECRLTDEIAAVCRPEIVLKSSTNGMNEPEFLSFIERTGSDTFVVCGVCTDICVMQIAVALKAYFNRKDKLSRIVVPVNAVATYDLGAHDARLCQTMALYNMSINGVELCSGISG